MNVRVGKKFHVAVLAIWAILILPMAILMYGMGGGLETMRVVYMLNYVDKFGVNDVLFWWIFSWLLFIFPALYLLILIIIRFISKARN